MAGKFFTVEEAAQRLGVSAEEVQRLVDRKELYPVRDGTTLKFKHDDIERYVADAGAASGGSGLSLELDAGPAGGDALEIEGLDFDAPAASGLEIDLGDSLPINAGASGGVTGSGGPAAAKSDGLSLDGDLALEDDLQVDDGLAMDTPAAAPSPPKRENAADPAEPNTATLPIDLSGIPVGGPAASGSNATGSIVSGSGTNALDLSGMGSNIGSALSGVQQDGLSLEDSDARKSGILSDPDFASGLGSAIKSASSPAMSGLAGEEIEEFAPDTEDSESAVVTDDASSFVDDGSASITDDFESSGIDDVDKIIPATDIDLSDTALLPDASFSVWQICGLVCCALIMLTGCFLMYDLVRTIGSTAALNRSSPLLNPMADLFGWRR